MPQLTSDLDQLKYDIDTYGFCYVKDALTPDQVSALRTRLVEQAEAERQQNVAYEDGGAKQNWGDFRDANGRVRKEAFTAAGGGVNQRVWMLINKGRVFREVFDVVSVRALVGHVLGEEYLLSSYGANIAKPGGVPMDLHTDQWWMPGPVRRARNSIPVGTISRQQPNWVEDEPPVLIAPPACVNVMWMLVDFSAENGGTNVVPGSHLYGRYPNKESQKGVETVAATGPAGTAMVFDGRIWHGTGANTSDGERLGLLTTFCGPQFRTQENFALGTSKEVVEEASPDLLALLGFKVWNAYGRIGSPLAEYVSQDASLLGEMRPT